MLELTVIAILGLAGYRITRAILFDSWIDGFRLKWYNFLVGGERFKLIRDKAMELTSCSFCMGFWVSLALTSLYLKEFPWDFTVNNWISTAAVAAIQSFIHVLEPED